MRIGIMVWSMCSGKGGMEKSGAELANFLQRSGHDVTLFYNRKAATQNTPVYPLHKHVQLCGFDIFRAGQGLEQARGKILKTAPDVMIVFFSHSDLLVVPGLLHNTGIPYIYAERSAASVIMSEQWNKKEHLACASSADAIVLFFESFKKDYPEFLHERIRAIPNAVEKPRSLARPDQTTSGRWQLLGVGKLHDRIKQFSLLIQALAILADSFPDWDLCLCGDGINRPVYELLARELNLENRISFTGVVEDVSSYYAASHLFCIPSRFEGFGRVTVEAMRHGLPAVGFSGCPGTNELILHGTNGLLAPQMTPEALAEALYPLMKSASLRKQMGEKAIETSARFSPKVVFQQWRELVEEVAQYKGKTRLNIDIPQDDEARAAAMLATILQRDYPFEELPRKM